VEDDNEELAECTRCEMMVPIETLFGHANWRVCEICWDDL
jgi:hypothetical protein